MKNIFYLLLIATCATAGIMDPPSVSMIQLTTVSNLWRKNASLEQTNVIAETTAINNICETNGYVLAWSRMMTSSDYVPPGNSGTNWWIDEVTLASRAISTLENVSSRWRLPGPLDLTVTNLCFISFSARAAQPGTNWRIMPNCGNYHASLANLTTNWQDFSFFATNFYGSPGNYTYFIPTFASNANPSLPTMQVPGFGYDIRDLKFHAFKKNPAVAAAMNAEIQLPPVLFLAPGFERNLYWRNFIWVKGAGIADVVPVTYETYVGTNRADFWRWKPPGTADNTTNIMQLKVYNLAEKLLALKTVQIVVAGTNNSATRKILFMGDSTTAGGTMTGEFLRLVSLETNLNLTLLGTVDNGGGTNRCEAYSGWRVEDFTTNVMSKFLIGTNFSFDYYLTNNSYAMSSNDWLIIANLGINNISTSATDADCQARISVATNALNTIITNAQAAVPGLRVAIGYMLPVADSQDAFGQFGNAPWRARDERNHFMFNSALATAFSGRNNIWMVDANAVVDAKNNYPKVNAAINERNTNVVSVASDAHHPAESGYYQLSDLWYGFIKSMK